MTLSHQKSFALLVKKINDIIVLFFHKWSASCAFPRRHPATGTCHTSPPNLCDTKDKPEIPPSHPACEMSVSPVSLLWSFLSVLVAATCNVSFFFPIWISHPDFVHSFGMFSYCVRDLQHERPRPMCLNYGGVADISRIPAGAWQAACILYGGGCVFQGLGALLSIVVLCVNRRQHHRLALLNGYLQTVAVLIMAAGLIMYPMGFGTPFFKYYCGEEAGPYRTGHCRLGWSYMLAIMGVALSIFCPILSNYTDVKPDEDDLLTFV